MATNFYTAFQSSCCFRLSESQRMLAKALALVDEKFLWTRPNTRSNSLGNQLLHMEGNLRQYIIATLGGKQDNRLREKEFDTQGGIAMQELWTALDATIKEAILTIKNCDEATFLETHHVQAFQLSGVDVALHAVEHLSYHVGQVAFWIKQNIATDLGFYEGLDLSNTNTD